MWQSCFWRWFFNCILPDKYITQKICDEAVDDSLAALKLIPDWFVTRKMIKKLFTALYADENILYFNEDSGNVVFNCNGMVILNIDLNVNVDNNFWWRWFWFYYSYQAFCLVYIKFEKRKEVKRKVSEELTPVAWHPKRWWNFCMSEDEEK